MPINSKKTAAIFLGASHFPKSKAFDPSEAFSEAKKRILDYFKNQISLDEDNLLDLFDSDFGADDQDSKINDFLKTRVVQGIEDLFVYYVGHGSFAPSDETYYLAIKSTRDENPSISSITVRTLANTIRQAANNIRTFLVLDCCFAAAAGTGFMSDAAQLPAIQFKDLFATKGIALLCASSKDLPALIIQDRKITMFTESFDYALRHGDSSIANKYLSLRQLHELTYSQIRIKNPGKSVRPEVLSPIQIEGDIADLPHFENFSFSDIRYDIVAKKREIEGAMIRNNFVELGNLFIDFVRNFDVSQVFNIQSVLLCSECNEIAEEKSSLERAIYKERKDQLYIEIISIIERILNQDLDSN